MKFVDPNQAPVSEDAEKRTYINPPQMIGHLLLVWVIDYQTDVPTKYPRKDDRGNLLPADAVFCDIVDLNMPDENGQRGFLMRRSRWTQGRLIRDTKKWVGCPDPLLVSMGKDGDAYIITFQDKNPGAVSVAEEWASRNPNFVPGADAPQPRESEPQPDPWAVNDWNSVAPSQDSVWPPATTSQPTSTPPAANLDQQRQGAMDRLRAQANLPIPPQDEEIPF